MNTIKEKLLHYFIISIFCSLYFLVATISMINSVAFFDLTHSGLMSWSLAIGFEIGAAASLAAIIILDKTNKTMVWGLFLLLTSFQMMANSFHAFINLENYIGWIQLFGLEEAEAIEQKRILSIVSGAILPVVALGFIKSLVDYIRPAEEPQPEPIEEEPEPKEEEPEPKEEEPQPESKEEEPKEDRQAALKSLPLTMQVAAQAIGLAKQEDHISSDDVDVIEPLGDSHATKLSSLISYVEDPPSSPIPVEVGSVHVEPDNTAGPDIVESPTATEDTTTVVGDPLILPGAAAATLVAKNPLGTRPFIRSPSINSKP